MVKIHRITKEKIYVFPILKREKAHPSLIFHVRMNNEAAVSVAKDVNVLLILIYALDQLKCFLPPRYMSQGNQE